jgi:hypothetical protein
MGRRTGPAHSSRHRPPDSARQSGQNLDQNKGPNGNVPSGKCDVASRCTALESYAVSVILRMTCAEVPAALATKSNWSRGFHDNHCGFVTAGSFNHRTTEPIDRSIAMAVASSHESMASPSAGMTRTGNPATAATDLDPIQWRLPAEQWAPGTSCA